MKSFRRIKIFLCMGVALIVLVGFYIFQINSLTAGAYGATASQKKVQQLRGTAASLQAAMAQSRTVSNIGELASQLNFEKVGTVQYIRVLAGSVAER